MKNKMKQFEYTMVSVKKHRDLEETSKTLNEMGAKGWELVTMFDRDSYYTCTFKKEIKNLID